jgi:ribonuclease I
MKLDELEKLADAAYTSNDDLEEFHYKANPQTIKQLIALVRFQHEALKEAKITMDSDWGEQPDSKQDKAIAAYEQFGGG